MSKIICKECQHEVINDLYCEICQKSQCQHVNNECFECGASVWGTVPFKVKQGENK